MTEALKRRLVRYCTKGDEKSDLEAGRRKRIRALRRVIHACFYYHCAAAAGCIAAAVMLGAGAAWAAVAVGSAAAVVIAFMSVGGGSAEKTIVYILDLAYTVICFTAGAEAENGAPFFVCGAIMLTAALAALASFFAAYIREQLEKLAAEKPTPIHEPHSAEQPAPSAKSEMRELAEMFSEKMK